MSDTAVMILGILELLGLVGFFVYMRKEAKRREEGKPRRPRAVRIAVALAALFVVVGYPAMMALAIVNPTIQAERRHHELVQTGTRASATITAIQETGNVINHQPEVRVRMTVQPRNAPAFQSQETWVFSVTDTRRYRIGTNVHVHYDPADRTTVAVVGVAPSSG